MGESLVAQPVTSGLDDWLKAQGLRLGKGLVLDPHSGALPIPVERPIGGGMSVREIQLAPYPYIVDVRHDGMDADSPVTANLGQLSVPWAAPVEVDAAANKARHVTTLLRSSPQSWVSTSTDLLPDYRSHPDLGFAPGDPRGAQPLAVAVVGRFDSAFKGQPSPLLAAAAASAPAAAAPASAAASAPLSLDHLGRVIEHSPASARLVLIGSNAVFSDAAMSLEGQAQGSAYRKPADFALNLVEDALEDPGLLAIRGRSGFARTLDPMPPSQEPLWEYADYVAVLLLLAGLWWLQRRLRRGRALAYQPYLQEA